MVTTSYLMRNDSLPAPMRQALLEKHYWFKCRCQACTSGIDACAQLPCPRCYPAVRDAAGFIKSPRKIGQLDRDAFTFTFHSVLEPHYIACDMRRASTGHPRPWLCGHCGAELEDTAEALFPAALLASRQWRQRPDLQLTQMVLNLDRQVGNELAGEAAFQVLDAMFTEALGVLGFKHFAVYRLVQLQAEFMTQKLHAPAHLHAALARMSLTPRIPRDAAVAVREAQRKWAMLMALTRVLGRESGDVLQFCSLKLQSAVHDLMPVASASPAVAGSDAVAAAQQLAAQLIRLQVQYYVLENQQGDPGAEETLELLACWVQLQAAQQGLPRTTAERALRLDAAGWRMLAQPLKGPHHSADIKLFDRKEELALARSWLSG